MEHLMSAKERGERHTEIRDVPAVPWLGYDHDESCYPLTTLKQYPVVRGWTIAELQELEHGNVGFKTVRQVLTMIQSWMFFGLLESAFNTRFRTCDFVVTATDGRRLVHTTYLRKWIDDYHSTVILDPQACPSQRRTQKDRLVESLSYAALWNQRLVDVETHGRGRSPLPWSPLFGPVTRLITLIAEAVWTVAQTYPSPDDRFFIDCNWSLTQGNDRALRERLKARGWCPSLYDKIKNLSWAPASLLEYVSLLSSQEDQGVQHQQCSLDECVQYNINESQYRTKHREDGCRCRMLRPPLADVNDALRQSRIPVINAASLLSPDSESIVRGHSSENPLDFVAFSHVWSDGLGSTTEAGLPQCQIQYLMDTSLRAAGTPMFWIDSLCIPRASGTRKLAISMMSTTYGSASATVVLDKRIQRCDSKRSLETKMIALSLSTWQERLWTLQESSLSRRLIFKFQSDLVLAEAIVEEGGSKIHRPVIGMAQLLLDNLTHWVHSNQVTVGGLQRNLYRRTSTKPGDECLAVAPFLNIDVKKLVQVEGEERMVCFWDEVQQVPRGVIFHNLEEISRPGYRWAPRSLMNQKNAVVLDLKDTSAQVTKSGLKGRYCVYTLHIQLPLTTRPESGYLDASAESWLKLHEGGTESTLSLQSDSVVAFETQLKPSGQDQLGVILRRVSDPCSQHPRTYEYGHVVSTALFSKAFINDLLGFRQGWDMVKQSKRGDFEVEWAEILIR